MESLKIDNTKKETSKDAKKGTRNKKKSKEDRLREKGSKEYQKKVANFSFAKPRRSKQSPAKNMINSGDYASIPNDLEAGLDGSQIPQTAQPKNQKIILQSRDTQPGYEHFVQTLQNRKSFARSPDTSYLEDNSHHMKEDSTLKSLFQPSTAQQETSKEPTDQGFQPVVKSKKTKNAPKLDHPKTSINTALNRTQNSLFSQASNSIMKSKIDPSIQDTILLQSIQAFNEQMKPAQNFAAPKERKGILMKASLLKQKLPVFLRRPASSLQTKFSRRFKSNSPIHVEAVNPIRLAHLVEPNYTKNKEI